MKTSFQSVFQNWITTLLGVVIMCFSGYYFYINVQALTLQNILIGAVLGAVGFVFLFVKDDLITGLFKRNLEK